MSRPTQPLVLTRTEGAVVVPLIRGAAWEGGGQDPRVTCSEKSRSPQPWQERGAEGQGGERADSRQ